MPETMCGTLHTYLVLSNLQGRYSCFHFNDEEVERFRELTKYTFQDHTKDSLGCVRDHDEMCLPVQLWSHILLWFEPSSATDWLD